MNMEKEDEKKGFDLRVTHRDPITGVVTHTTPYTLRVIGTGGGQKTQLFERPPKSGNLFDGQGRPFGRWENGKHNETANHVIFAPPLTTDQKLAQSVIEKDSRIAELQRELASIKAEEKRPPVEEKKKY